MITQDIQHDPPSFLRRLGAGEELRVIEGARVFALIHPVPPAVALCDPTVSAPA